MTRDELRRLIVGPVATVATPFDDDFEVDYGKIAELTRFWVESGLVAGKAVIKIAAAMGEGPMLSDDEWPRLLGTVVAAAKGKAAVTCGLHYRDTKRAIDDAKRAQDLGAIGLQISPPIFNEPNQDDILRYFEAISDAIDIGIMVYNTYWLPGGNILPETFLRMKDFEHLVAIKWSVPEGQDYDAMRDLAPIFNVIDNHELPVRCHKLGGRGYINLTADVYPPHDLQLWDLLESRRYEEAQALFEKVTPPLRALYNKFHQRSGGEARLKKGMMALIGWHVGSSRPPSLPLNDDETAELRRLLLSFGWPVPQ